MAERTPKRIQLSRKHGWRKPQDAVVCSRPGRWGNPFALHAALDKLRERTDVHASDANERLARSNVVRAFEEALRAGELKFSADDVRRELHGKDLCCWCRLCPKHRLGKAWDARCEDCAPCHVDVLLQTANAP